MTHFFTRYGYKFLARKPESVVIQTPNGEEEEYQGRYLLLSRDSCW